MDHPKITIHFIGSCFQDTKNQANEKLPGLFLVLQNSKTPMHDLSPQGL